MPLIILQVIPCSPSLVHDLSEHWYVTLGGAMPNGTWASGSHLGAVWDTVVSSEHLNKSNPLRSMDRAGNPVVQNECSLQICMRLTNQWNIWPSDSTILPCSSIPKSDSLAEDRSCRLDKANWRREKPRQTSLWTLLGSMFIFRPPCWNTHGTCNEGCQEAEVSMIKSSHCLQLQFFTMNNPELQRLSWISANVYFWKTELDLMHLSPCSQGP